MDQPDYLILNTPCGQVSLYPWQDAGPSPAYAVGLHEWVTSAGYRWVGNTCQIGRSGREITGDDYVPRRLMGEYLQWFYATLVASAPAKLEIVHRHTEAIDIVSQRDGRERVVMANGECLEIDHVILTSGHTGNVEPDANPALLPRPYPVDRYVRTIPRGATVAVEGLGLVATDVVIALTVGRGGSFAESGDRLRYVSSGMSRRSGAFPVADSLTVRRRQRPSTRATSSRPSSAPKTRSGHSRAGMQRVSLGARSTSAPRSCR